MSQEPFTVRRRMQRGSRKLKARRRTRKRSVEAWRVKTGLIGGSFVFAGAQTDESLRQPVPKLSPSGLAIEVFWYFSVNART